MNLYLFLFTINLVFGSLAIYLLYLVNSSTTIKLPEKPNLIEEEEEEEEEEEDQNIFGDGFLYDDNLYDEYGNLRKGINLNVKSRNVELNNIPNLNLEAKEEGWDIINPWKFRKKKKLSIKLNSSNMSSGEREVMKALQFYNIQFETEYTMPKYRYRWDFFCPEYNLFIEYDGQQHFYPKSFGEETEEKTLENFQKLQLADKHKDEIVKDMGAYTLRIPFNKKNETGILIEDEIQRIKNIEN